MAKSFTLLVWGKDGGIIASEAFGHWVYTNEAVATTRELYPDSIALMDRETGAILWDVTGKKW